MIYWRSILSYFENDTSMPVSSLCMCTTTSLTLYTLTSVCIFSILFSIHFPSCWQGEFVSPSRASLVCDHCLYSLNLNVWFRGETVRRNYKLVTLGVKGFILVHEFLIFYFWFLILSLQVMKPLVGKFGFDFNFDIRKRYFNALLLFIEISAL